MERHGNSWIRPSRVLAAALVAFGLLAGLGPERAAAGGYTVVECDPDLGTGHRDAGYERTSADFLPAAGCAKGGGGLDVSHRRSGTLVNRFGRWAFAAPPGTSLVAASARAAGHAAGGVLPELLVRAAGDVRRIAVPAGQPRRLSWSGAGQALLAGLACRHSPRCSASRGASIRVDRIRLKLEDPAVPSVNLGGSLVGERVVRDVQRIEASAGDLGGGVQRLWLTVNGEPAGSSASACSLAGKLALRATPCPPNALVPFAADTARRPYRQGRNLLRLCAQDYAARGKPNVRCARAKVRVDNLCPVSSVTTGTQLSAAVTGTPHPLAARGSDRPRVGGRLTDSLGQGIEGARVCVAATEQAPGAGEHLLATTVTDAAGRFSVPVRSGPARRLRVAYWPGDNGEVERSAAVRFRARPALEIHPRGVLQNGDRARFAAHLRPPYEAGRLVRIEARSAGRWVPVTSGRTGAGGVFRGSYRFHATHGRRIYRFRAAVPRQAGYPYAAGVSSIRRKVVRGR